MPVLRPWPLRSSRQHSALSQGWRRSLVRLGISGRLLLAGLWLVGLLALRPEIAAAAPGLCVGPVCGDTISRSAQYHWQLRLRISDQRSHRERVMVDCRSGVISPAQGMVERGYAAAVARRACRLAGEAPG